MTLIFAAPELSLHQSVKYVAGAYAVFLAIVLIYLWIMARRLRNSERDLVELRRELHEHEAAQAVDGDREGEPVA